MPIITNDSSLYSCFYLELLCVQRLVGQFVFFCIIAIDVQSRLFALSPCRDPVCSNLTKLHCYGIEKLQWCGSFSCGIELRHPFLNQFLRNLQDSSGLADESGALGDEFLAAARGIPIEHWPALVTFAGLSSTDRDALHGTGKSSPFSGLAKLTTGWRVIKLWELGLDIHNNVIDKKGRKLVPVA